MKRQDVRAAATLWLILLTQALLNGCSSSAVQPSPHANLAPSYYAFGNAPLTLPGSQIPALVLSGKYNLQLYNASGKEFKSIRVHGYQGAVALDKQGNIYYDTYEEYNDRVLIFQPPYTAKPKVVSTYGDSLGVVIDWKSGVFAVMTDAINEEPEQYSSIAFFRHGATTPCAVLKEPSDWIWAPTGAFDANGTLFTVGTSSGSGITLVSAAGQCNAKNITTYSPVLRNALHLQFDAQNQLVVEESNGFSNSDIVTYPHPSEGQLGTPLSFTTLQELKGAPTAMLTLTSNGSRLWASNFNNSVGLYSYPQGGAPLAVMAASNIGDAAVYPQLSP